MRLCLVAAKPTDAVTYGFLPAAARLEDGLEQARGVFDELAAAGLDYDDLTDTLEREGVEKFAEAFEQLTQTLGGKRDSLAPA